MPTINQNPPRKPQRLTKKCEDFLWSYQLSDGWFCRRTVPVLCGLEVTGSVFGYNNSRHVDVGFRYLMASDRDIKGGIAQQLGHVINLSIGIKFPTPFFL
jgi:hypothetical protein